MKRVWGERVRWTCRLLVGVGVVATMIVVLFLIANRVDPSITSADREVILDLDLDEDCGVMEDFNAQIDCIRATQATVDVRYFHTKDVFQKGVSGHELSDYVERGYGSCYDRGLLIEKTLAHYGLPTRRVAIYQQQRFPWLYLTPGIRSHALSEVKTARGWIFVDTISPLAGVDKQNKTYTIRQLRKALQDDKIDHKTFGLPISENFFDGDFVYARGVYSRHGYFFKPHIPVPEVSWKDFRLW